MVESFENRKFIRVKTGFPLKHVKFHLGLNVADALQSLSKDLSAGGLLFESSDLYAEGDILRLEIDLPGWEKFKPEFFKPHISKSGPVIALVKVLRVKRVDFGRYEIAALFVGIDEGHQMALVKYVKSRNN